MTPRSGSKRRRLDSEVPEPEPAVQVEDDEDEEWVYADYGDTTLHYLSTTGGFADH